jgi:hypothetical protein
MNCPEKKDAIDVNSYGVVTRVGKTGHSFQVQYTKFKKKGKLNSLLSPPCSLNICALKTDNVHTNVTSRGVRLTTVAVKQQYVLHILSVCL